MRLTKTASKIAFRAAAGLSAAALATMLSGCGAGLAAPNSPIESMSFSGTVMGGRSPIKQATVNLYAATTTGYGGVPILRGTATTNSIGKFTITASGNPCTDPDQIYITSTGGDAGTGTANPAAVLVEALGVCSSVDGSTQVLIDEESTVAAAYALSGFAQVDGSSTQIGTSSANQAGMSAAFANAANLSTLDGVARTATVTGNGVVPQAVLNTLADSLVSCVNSNGSGDLGCQHLMVAYPNGITPTNTWQIALEWALYPGVNVAPTYSNFVSDAAFYTPLLNAQPSDLSLAIAYKAGYAADGTTPVTAPVDLKVDASGNIWLSGMVGANLVELAPDGSVTSLAGGDGGSSLKAATGVAGMAIDTASPPNVWLASSGNSKVYQYTSSTASTTAFSLPLSVGVGPTPPGTTTTVKNSANTVAVDSSNNIWYGTATAAKNATNMIGEITLASGVYTVNTYYKSSPLISSSSSKGTTYLTVNTSNSNQVMASANGLSGTWFWTSPYTTDVTYGGLTSGNAAGQTVLPSTTKSYVLGTGTTSANGRVCSYSASGATSSCNQMSSIRMLTGVAPTDGAINLQGLTADGSGKFFMTTLPTTASSATQTTSLMEYNPTGGQFYNTGTSATTVNGYNPVASDGTSLFSGAVFNNLEVDQAGATWLANSAPGAAYPVFQVLGPATPTVAPFIAGYASRP